MGALKQTVHVTSATETQPYKPRLGACLIQVFTQQIGSDWHHQQRLE